MTGLRSQEAGDLRGAEEAYRRADERGDAGGAFHLGRLLAERGQLAAAAAAYRRADRRGEPAAATNLGVMLEQEGDLAGAAAAYRRASERGHAPGAVNLGRLLARHHDVVGAEAAYRRASALGDDGALDLLAGLVAERAAPPSREAKAADARRTDGAKRRSRFARPVLRRRREGTWPSPASKASSVSSVPPGDRQSGAPEQATATSSPERPAEPVVTAVGRPEEPSTEPRAGEPAASEPPVASPEDERPEEPAATQAPELATAPVTAATSTRESGPGEPTPTPANAPAPAADEAAPLNGPPPEAARRRIELVTMLQAQLSFLGFDPGPADGRYGPLTTDAVIRFQQAHRLTPDGVVGPLTAEALRTNLRNPLTSERVQRVKALQRQLRLLGLEPGPVDGRYGALTTGAVTRFQQAHGLPVDGVVGPLTAEALRAILRNP
jgi:peptidoglycan hydrolase-like protein with peptidoglycan-binding domain